MVEFLFSPTWFMNFDVLIEIFSFLVLAGFFILCLRNYRLNKNENTLKLGIGFLLIALGEIVLILSKFVIYQDMLVTRDISGLTIVYHALKANYIISNVGFFLHKFFTLVGLYTLYRTHLKKWKSVDFLVGIYFVIVAALFGFYSAQVFHITAAILLLLVILDYRQVYKKNKYENTKIILGVFLVLLTSQALFMIGSVEFFYVIGEVFQLASYILLLSLIIRINYGKKKK